MTTVTPLSRIGGQREPAVLAGADVEGEADEHAERGQGHRDDRVQVREHVRAEEVQDVRSEDDAERNEDQGRRGRGLQSERGTGAQQQVEAAEAGRAAPGPQRGIDRVPAPDLVEDDGRLFAHGFVMATTTG